MQSLNTQYRRIYPKYWDIQAWANSVDPDQTPQLRAQLGLWSGSTLLATYSAILDTTTGSKIKVQILGQIC